MVSGMHTKFVTVGGVLPHPLGGEGRGKGRLSFIPSTHQYGALLCFYRRDRSGAWNNAMQRQIEFLGRERPQAGAGGAAGALGRAQPGGLPWGAGQGRCAALGYSWRGGQTGAVGGKIRP